MTYDVVVIGSGPGGYIAAIRCAQLGMKTAIIERYTTLGGTCLNVGCIPSKALLDSSEHYYAAAHKFAAHGLKINGSLEIDMPQMMLRKTEVVGTTTKGVEFLMKKNKIDVFTGHGSFVSSTKISIAKADGTKEEIESKNIIIATGSKPITPANFNYDKKRIVTSTEALKFEAVPKSLVVVGGGVIGLELGSVYARLGTEVHVVEYVDRIIASMDSDCSKEMQRALKDIGIKFYLKHAVTDVQATDHDATVTFKSRDTEEVKTITADYCLLALGRRPYTDNLGLENAGVERDEKGRVKVDDHLKTTAANIYAIGDVIHGAMLAHKAEDEGVYVAETIAGQKPHINYNLIPNVVYTWPEAAGVGQTEEQLKTDNVPYKIGKFPMKALGRARASGDIEGMIKVLAHKDTDEVLGVHMVGARVADLIAEAVALMEFRASAEDIGRISHAHPTYAEAFRDAALAASANRALNI